MNKQWWKEAVVYQVYPKSFNDTNGDGIGDLRGIIEKLDYLVDLGINVLWICPMYQSPMDDNGYDISDYYKVAEEFGTNEDLDELLQKSKAKGLKVILDLVVNHCSDEHAWFQEALKNPESEEASYFYFVKPENDEVPNNWRSNFGGSAWDRTADGRYYLHSFGKKQPDLNWENPKLREKIYDMINWWLERGIDGFRVDAITFIKKDTTFQSGPAEDEAGRYCIEHLINYPGIGDFLREMKARTFARHNSMTVAEAPGVPYDQLSDYAGEDGYFSMIFEFSYTELNQHKKGWSVETFKKTLYKSQEEAKKAGWFGVFLENHDHPRSPDKYISEAMLEKYGDRPKKMLASLFFLLRGTPFIYQGQEIGMVNYPFKTIDDFKDVSAITMYQETLEKGGTPEQALQAIVHTARDNSRTPMQWDNTMNAGFTTGEPWLAVNLNYPGLNVQEQASRPDSVLAYYRQMIALRKNPQLKEALVNGEFVPLDQPAVEVIAYQRKSADTTVIVISNFSAHKNECILPKAPEKILLSNCDEVKIEGRKIICEPYQSIVLI
jgi:glycosidase